MQSCYHPLKKWWVYSIKTSYFICFLPLNERYGRTSIPVNGRTGTAKESKFVLKKAFSLTSVVILIFNALISDIFAEILLKVFFSLS